MRATKLIVQLPKENKILFILVLLISLAISYLSYKTYNLDSVSVKVKLENKDDTPKQPKPKQQPVVYIPEPALEDPTKPRPVVRTIHQVCIAGHLYKYSFEPVFELGQQVSCIGTPDDL